MSKSPTHSEVELLRGEVRTLKKEVRTLKNQLARAQKRQHQWEGLEEREKELEETIQTADPKPTKNRCLKCGGTLEVIDLVIRVITTCNSCNERIVTKKD